MHGKIDTLILRVVIELRCILYACFKYIIRLYAKLNVLKLYWLHVIIFQYLKFKRNKRKCIINLTLLKPNLSI